MYYNAVDERGEIIINGMSDRGEIYEYQELSPFGDFAMLYNVTQELSESTSIADSLAKEPEKHTADTIHLSDSESKTMIHSIIESLTATDSVIKHPEKRVTDTIAMTDSIVQREVNKYIHETLTLVDSVRRAGDCLVSDIYSYAARLTKNSIVRVDTKNSKTGRQR